jgi:hypothetical protein
MADRAAARNGSNPEITELTKIFMRQLYCTDAAEMLDQGSEQAIASS